jgi:hypothetical protein
VEFVRLAAEELAALFAEARLVSQTSRPHGGLDFPACLDSLDGETHTRIGDHLSTRSCIVVTQCAPQSQ